MGNTTHTFNNEPSEFILENLIDSYGLSNVLSQISQICYDKSNHLLDNWQDSYASKDWDKSGDKINTLQRNILEKHDL